MTDGMNVHEGLRERLLGQMRARAASHFPDTGVFPGSIIDQAFQAGIDSLALTELIEAADAMAATMPCGADDITVDRYRTARAKTLGEGERE